MTTSDHFIANLGAAVYRLIIVASVSFAALLGSTSSVIASTPSTLPSRTQSDGYCRTGPGTENDCIRYEYPTMLACEHDERQYRAAGATILYGGCKKEGSGTEYYFFYR